VFVFVESQTIARIHFGQNFEGLVDFGEFRLGQEIQISQSGHFVVAAQGRTFVDVPDFLVALVDFAENGPQYLFLGLVKKECVRVE